jgi:XTP/dITP diphosphohydrolase
VSTPSTSLVVLKVSPLATPGQMTFEAWRVARTSQVFGAAGSPWSAALADAGVPVESVDASDVGGAVETVLHACGAATSVLWVDDGTMGASEVATAAAGAGVETGIGVTTLVGAAAPVGSAVAELAHVMDVLRSPGGCPWDAEQTHASLRTYLLEEVYEVADAIDAGDDDHLREELGDLLLQIVFHARIAQERATGFDLDDVARGIVDKMVRRHPHVFADGDASTADEVAATWDDLKRAEKGRTSVFDGIAASQPSLPLAQSYVRRATTRGLPAPAADPSRPDDVGEHLLAVIARASAKDVDAEASLRAAADRYAERIRAIESADGADSDAGRANSPADPPADD